MVKHIVMWKLKDEHKGTDKNKLAEELKLKLMALKNSISEIIHIQVGINAIHFDKNADVILICDFNNFDDLAKYAIHPEHAKVGAFVKQIVVDRLAVDYEY